jgi:hypothetical protein
MPGLLVSRDPLLELLEGSALGRLLEQGPVNVLRAIAARTPDDDPLILFVPLQDRTRTDAELPEDFLGHGDLSLRGEP